MGCGASQPKYIVVTPSQSSGDVTLTDISLVKQSFGELDNMELLGHAFYDQLFQTNPAVRSLFFSDTTKQAERLVSMLDIAVKHLENRDTLVPVLEQLARRHVRYGVTALHYPLVGEALMKVLSAKMGARMDVATTQAWTRVYGLISTVMLNAAKQEVTKEEFVISFPKEELLWVMTDLAGVITKCSKSFCSALDFKDPAQLTGKSICSLQPPFVSALHDSYLKQYNARAASTAPAPRRTTGCPVLARAPLDSHPREVSLTDSAGNPRMFAVKITPVDGGFCAIFEDRTAHREMEQLRDRLLQEVLPARVAQMLLVNPKALIAMHYTQCSILFCDVVGFTALSAKLESRELLRHLNTYYSVLDDLLKLFALLKLKTIGDAYMCAAGLPDICEGTGVSLACFAIQMLHVLRTQLHAQGLPFQVRVGINCGEVSGGVVGNTRPQFDLFGDEVNVASRMESSGAAMQIHISQRFADLLEPSRAFVINPRGAVEVKGKGAMNTCWLVGYAGTPPPPLPNADTIPRASPLLAGLPLPAVG